MVGVVWTDTFSDVVVSRREERKREKKNKIAFQQQWSFCAVYVKSLVFLFASAAPFCFSLVARDARSLLLFVVLFVVVYRHHHITWFSGKQEGASRTFVFFLLNGHITRRRLPALST